MWGYPDPRGPSQATNSNTAGGQQRANTSRVSLSLSTPECLQVVTLEPTSASFKRLKHTHRHTHTHTNRQSVASALAETQHLGVRLAFQDIPVAMPSLRKHTGSSLINLWV